MNPGSVIHGYKINQKGIAKKINTIPEDLNDLQYYWFHLNATNKGIDDWFDNHLSIPAVARDMMVSNNTRPNIVKFDQGTLVTLRAVNFEENEEKEKFNAINIWISDKSIITVRHFKIMAIEDLVESFNEEEPFLNIGEFIVELIHHLQKRVTLVIRALEEQAEAIEEGILSKSIKDVRSDLILMRKKIVQVRRYIIPQRELLQQLAYDKFDFLQEESRLQMLYYYDKMVRLVEEIDIVRDHLMLSQEEVVNTQNDLMNKSMYRISIVSALFLPLGFITGLLGVNIAGMPGTDDPSAFTYLVYITLAYLIGTTGYFIWQKKL